VSDRNVAFQKEGAGVAYSFNLLHPLVCRICVGIHLLCLGDAKLRGIMFAMDLSVRFRPSVHLSVYPFFCYYPAFEHDILKTNNWLPIDTGGPRGPGTCRPAGPASHSPFPFPSLPFPTSPSLRSSPLPFLPYLLSPPVTSLPFPSPPSLPLEVEAP